MSEVCTLRSQSLRLTSALVVLLGAATLVGACNSGDVASRGASADDSEQVSVAAQGLGWPGGCVCLRTGSCPTGTKYSCAHQPSSSECPKLIRCSLLEEACYVEPDGTSCGLPNTCDGGYCGTCPGCYLENGLCAQNSNLVATCGEVRGKCVNCNDSNECTTDSCSLGRCTHKTLDDGTVCTGGVCYKGNCCTGCVLDGGCKSGVDPIACGTAGKACVACPKPANLCMRAICKEGTCAEEPWPEGTACPDETVCNGSETCNGAGTCQKGKELDCKSNDPCIIGSCDAVAGCVKTPASNATKCTDNNGCTVGDLCNGAGTCVGGSPKACDDSTFCTTDSCDPATGQCVYTNQPNGTNCDDGAVCTTNDQCVDGSCVGDGINCDDGLYCTTDSVDCSVPTPTCAANPAPMNGLVCIPLNKCFYVGTCTDRACVANSATPVNCDDSNPCTADDCDPATGCTHVNEPATTLCSDGNPCTVDDHCGDVASGKCGGTPTVCAALDDCHLPGTCDPATGRCGSDPLRNDGDPCMRGTGQCISGACQVMATGGTSGVAGAAGYAGELANAGTAGIPLATGGTGATVVPTAGGVGAVGGASTTDNAAAGKTSTKVDPDDVFQRNPGGCSCNLPNRSSTSGLTLLGLVGLALARLGRRGRRHDP